MRWTAIAVGLVPPALLAAFLVPNLVEARKYTNEDAAVSALRTLTTTQSFYREGNYATRGWDLASIAPLSSERGVESLGALLVLTQNLPTPSPQSYSLVQAYLDRRVAPPPEVQLCAALDHLCRTEPERDLLYFSYAPSLKALGDSTLIDGVLASGLKRRYRFALRTSPTEPQHRWLAVANPIAPSAGRWSYAVNQAGVIYAAHDQPILLNPSCLIPSHARPLGR